MVDARKSNRSKNAAPILCKGGVMRGEVQPNRKTDYKPMICIYVCNWYKHMGVFYGDSKARIKLIIHCTISAQVLLLEICVMLEQGIYYAR